MTLVQGGTLRSQRDSRNLHHRNILSTFYKPILLKLLISKVEAGHPNHFTTKKFIQPTYLCLLSQDHHWTFLILFVHTEQKKQVRLRTT